MQLHFSAQESNLLADILLNERVPVGLFEQVLARHLHFDFDELEQLTQILAAHKQKVAADLEQCQDPKTKADLEARQQLMDSMIEKVDEACAML